jgi:hypothetical protein
MKKGILYNAGMLLERIPSRFRFIARVLIIDCGGRKI